jgi:lysozyme
MTDIQQLLQEHEAERSQPYLDCCGLPWRRCGCPVKGHLTVGIGRNLDAVPLTRDEIIMLLNLDIARAIEAVRALCPIYEELSRPRQLVLISMAFNLGKVGLSKFIRMWAAIEIGDWDEAADQMQASAWYRQVGRRGRDLVDMMRTSVSRWG